MVMISNTDQIMALVRSQLERMARGKRSQSARKSSKTAQPVSTSTSRLQALAGLSRLPREAFERVLVEALLTLEFGEEVARDPRFAEIVSHTTRIMQSDAALSQTMEEVRAELQVGGASDRKKD